MSLEEMLSKVRLITWNDDNHGVDVYVNGKYIDNMDNQGEAAFHLLTAGQSLAGKEIVGNNLYYPELAEEVGDETADKVEQIFRDGNDLTPEQELAILNKTYEDLLKI